MDIKLYSIRDIKLEKYGQPFVAPNDEIAKRMLQSTIRAGQTTIAEYPEDFQLFKLGEYNEDTGELKNEQRFVANATEFKKGEITNGVSNGMEQKENTNK